MAQPVSKIKLIIPNRFCDSGRDQVIDRQAGCHPVTNLGRGYSYGKANQPLAVEGGRQEYLF